MFRGTRPLEILFWSALILPLTVAAAASVALWHRTHTESRQAAAQTASILREHALRVFEAQEGAIDRIEGLIANLTWQEIETSREVHEFLARINIASPHIDGLWLVRPDGRTVASADFFPTPMSVVTDRDYFQALRQTDTAYLGRMIQGRLKGNWNFSYSRRRPTADGSFDGLILVTASLGYFENFWKGAIGNGQQTVSILRSDGEVLARYPTMPNVPTRIPESSPFFDAVRDADQGVFWSHSATDRRDRLFGFTKLGDKPAYILVGRDRRDVLASWLRQSLTLVLFGLAASLGLASLVRLAQRREQELSSEVERRRQAETSLVAKQEHVDALQAAEAALTVSEQRYRIAVSAISGIVYDWDLRTGSVYRSDNLEQFLGFAQGDDIATVDWWRSRLHPDDRHVLEVGRAAAIANREATSTAEYRIRHRDGRWLYVWDRGIFLRDGAGCPVRLIGSTIDVSERKENEERQKILINELNHRVKNTLFAVESIIAHTAKSASSPSEMTVSLRSRIQALSRAHDQLIHTQWESISLRRLIEEELAPYQHEDRVSLNGRDARLDSSTGVALSLVLHELATNAAKYGSLSVPEGSLEIDWTILDCDEGGTRPATLVWRERGGPAVAPPTRRGFGSRLIERSLSGLGGEAVLDFAPDGLVCTLVIALPDQRSLAATSLAR